MFCISTRRRTVLLIVGCAILGFSESAAPAGANLPVCTILYSHEAPQGTCDGTGGAIVAWHDVRDSSDVYDIFAQRIGGSGALVWTAQGVEVVGEIGAQLNPRVVSDSLGGAFVVWEDQRNGSDWDVYGQRLSPAGARLWGSEGVAISAMTGDQSDLDASADGLGGVLVVWVDHRVGESEADIYSQRVSATGAVVWQTDGVPVCREVGTQEQPRVIAQGDGGAIIVWKDKRSNSGDIYAQRVNGDGVAVWDSNGVQVCGATGSQNSPTLVSDALGGAIITWDDRRNGNGDIFAQRVNLAGAMLWTTNGIGVLVDPNDQYRPQIVSDGASGAIICWPGSSSIFVNRVTPTGSLAWDSSGVSICEADAVSDWPKMAADGSGGAVIVWEDTRNTPLKPDLFGQRVNASGAVLWTAPGVPVTTAPEDQRYAAVVSNGDGGMIVVWEDWRDGGYLAGRYQIYGQLLDGDGNPLPVTAISENAIKPPLFAVHQNAPNPFDDHTMVRIELQTSETVAVTIYDVLGRVVDRREFRGIPSGWQDLLLEAKDSRGERLPSGVYYYRVVAGNHAITRKMTVVR